MNTYKKGRSCHRIDMPAFFRRLRYMYGYCYNIYLKYGSSNRSAGNQFTESSSSGTSHFAASCSLSSRLPDTMLHQ